MHRVMLLLAIVLLASACTSVPKETVQLSETIAEQTASLQNAHEALVGRYYDGLRDRVEAFLKDVWIPAFLARAVNNPQVQQQIGATLAASNLDTAAIVQKINADDSLTAAEKAAVTDAVAKARMEGSAKFGDVMIRFSEEATRQIGLQRQALLEPIDEQERLVLDKLRATYANLQAEQATVRAFLASAVSLQEEEDLVLRHLDLLDARNRAVDTALSMSDDAADGLTSLEAAEKFLRDVKSANEKLRDSGSEP